MFRALWLTHVCSMRPDVDWYIGTVCIRIHFLTQRSGGSASSAAVLRGSGYGHRPAYTAQDFHSCVGGAAWPGTSQLFSRWRTIPGTDEFMSCFHLPVLSRCWGMLRRKCIGRKVVHRSCFILRSLRRTIWILWGRRRTQRIRHPPSSHLRRGFRNSHGHMRIGVWAMNRPSSRSLRTSLAGSQGILGAYRLICHRCHCRRLFRIVSDDSVTATMGSFREDSITLSEVIVIIPPVGDVLPVPMDAEILADSPLPTAERLLADLLWAPVAPRPQGISEHGDQRSSDRVPLWRLTREGPFLAERSTAALISFGAGCAFRNTSYRPSDYTSPLGEFGIPMNHPRLLEWIGVPESASLLEIGPGRWPDALSRDKAMAAAIQLQRDVCLMTIENSASKMLERSLGASDFLSLPFRWRLWGCGGPRWTLHICIRMSGSGLCGLP